MLLFCRGGQRVVGLKFFNSLLQLQELLLARDARCITSYGELGHHVLLILDDLPEEHVSEVGLKLRVCCRTVGQELVFVPADDRILEQKRLRAVREELLRICEPIYIIDFIIGHISKMRVDYDLHKVICLVFRLVDKTRCVSPVIHVHIKQGRFQADEGLGVVRRDELSCELRWQALSKAVRLVESLEQRQLGRLQCFLVDHRLDTAIEVLLLILRVGPVNKIR